jgi:hypothetical protein
MCGSWSKNDNDSPLSYQRNSVRRKYCLKTEGHRLPDEKKDQTIGDQYAHIGLERNTKLAARHLGRRRHRKGRAERHVIAGLAQSRDLSLDEISSPQGSRVQ